MLFTDPVFQVLLDYKNHHPGDVIRFELIIRAEIARIDQYKKHDFFNDHSSVFNSIRQERIDNLKQTLTLIPSYLDLQFREHLKTISFWERRALKAQAPNWKYTFYMTERSNAAEEITQLLSEAAKTTIKAVKEIKESKN